MTPSRWFWVLLMGIATCGLLLHLTGYNYGLPYVEEYDEGRLFYNGYILRGVAPGLAPDLPGYPPGIFALHSMIQPIFENSTGRPAELEAGLTIGALRFLSAIANFVSVLLLGLCARKLAGDMAGLLAAAAWWGLPAVLYNTVIALTEPWQIVCYMLALYFCLDALQHNRPRSAFFSVLAGLVAVIFKYSAFPVLGLGVGAALWQLALTLNPSPLWRGTSNLPVVPPSAKNLDNNVSKFYTKSTNSKVIWAWLFILCLQVAAIGSVAGYLFLIYGAGRDAAHPETAAFLSGGLAKLTNFTDIGMIIEKAIEQINLMPPIFLGLLLVGGIAHLRHGVTWQRLGWLLVAFFWLITTVFVVTYIVYWQGLNRYVIAASPMGVLLVAVSVAQIGRWLMGFIKPKSLRLAQALFFAGMGIFALWWLLPPLRGTIAIVQERTLPDTRGALMNWSLDVLRTEYTVILTDDREMRVFSRDRGGYRGVWLFSKHADLFEKSLSGWQAEDIDYVLASGDTLQAQLMNTPQGAQYLDDLLLLKQFPALNDTQKWRGQSLYFYRIGRMQTETDALFGEMIRLVGYDLMGVMQRGQTVQFTPYWQALAAPTADYNVYLHLRPADDLTSVAAQNDGQPVYNRPSRTWVDPGETLIGETFSLTIPADIVPGKYILLAGLYDYQTGGRLMTDAGTDFVVIAEFTIDTD